MATPSKRPLTRAQRAENRSFLALLRRTNNARLSARELGLKYGTMQHRRSRHPGFATAWDAALVLAQARLAPPPPRIEAGAVPLPERAQGGSFRTAAGEPHLVRLKTGRLQIRRAQPGKLT